MTSHELDGLMATLMNWSVSRFLLVWSMTFGTRDSSRLQLFRLAAPSSGRSFELQRDEMSAKVCDLSGSRRRRNSRRSASGWTG
jgi:hypothetical protein